MGKYTDVSAVIYFIVEEETTAHWARRTEKARCPDLSTRTTAHACCLSTFFSLCVATVWISFPCVHTHLSAPLLHSPHALQVLFMKIKKAKPMVIWRWLCKEDQHGLLLEFAGTFSWSQPFWGRGQWKIVKERLLIFLFDSPLLPQLLILVWWVLELAGPSFGSWAEVNPIIWLTGAARQNCHACFSLVLFICLSISAPQARPSFLLLAELISLVRLCISKWGGKGSGLLCFSFGNICFS